MFEFELTPSITDHQATQWRECIRKSYLSIEVLDESALVGNYTTTTTLGFVDVLSNVGGQKGRRIGISFLSLIEASEMIYRLIRYHIYLAGRKKTKTYDLTRKQQQL